MGDTRPLPIGQLARELTHDFGGFGDRGGLPAFCTGLEPASIRRELVFADAHASLLAIWSQMRDQEHIDYLANAVTDAVPDALPELARAEVLRAFAARIEAYRAAMARQSGGDHLASGRVLLNALDLIEIEHLPLAIAWSVMVGQWDVSRARFVRDVLADHELIA